VAPAREGTRLGWRGWFAVFAVSCSLLGQGERCRIERTFRAPSTTLQAYWEALRAGDAEAARACFAEGRPDVPMPGSVWFLPSTDDLWLTGYRALPVAPSRVMVSYEVHYRDGWSGDERMFRFGNELVRQRGEWRIAKSIGEASMPEWKPKDRPVDSSGASLGSIRSGPASRPRVTRAVHGCRADSASRPTTPGS
jgi:hypothetical protein